MAENFVWTKENTNHLIELIENQKVSYSEAAKELGTTYDAARGRYRRIRKKNVSMIPPRTGKIAIDSDGPNLLSINAKGPIVRTLKELIKACEIDLEEWAIDRHVVNQWQVYSNDAGLVPLYQVKAWLIRRKPVEITPTIKPILSSVKLGRHKPNRTETLKRALIIPDIHFGFLRSNPRMLPMHDRAALDLVIQIALDYEFSEVIYLGDVLDLAEWSDKFLTSPEMRFTTQDTLSEAFYWLGAIQLAAGEAPGWFLEGNHEIRAESAIMRHASFAHKIKAPTATYPALSIPALLDLSALGIQYLDDYPNNKYWLNDTTKAIHGNAISGVPGGTAKKLLDNSSVSTISGHAHRLEYASQTIFSRDEYRDIFGFVSGCLCQVGGIVPANKKNNNWQQGFAIVEYDNEKAQVTPISISNKKAMAGGHIYTARSAKEINKDIDTHLESMVT